VEQMSQMTLERYNRQSLIEGWNQEAWSRLSAIVIGDSLLAQHVADALVGTGVKSVKIVGNRRVTGDGKQDGFLAYDAQEGDFAVESVASLLSKVNPFVSAECLTWSTRGRFLEDILKNADMVFDTSNDSLTKNHIAEYAGKHDRFLVSGGCGRYKGCFKIVEKGDDVSPLDAFSGKGQGAFPSLVIAGMMVEEARKKFMPYDEFESGPIEGFFWYNLLSRERFSATDDFTIPEGDLRNYSILIAGAGALGVPLASSLIMETPGRLGILDYESPDESNLSRQTLYWDNLGQPKSESLAQKIRRMNPATRVIAYSAKLAETHEDADYPQITPDELLRKRYNVIARCFDNFKATVILNNLKVPIVYGGTTYGSASVSTYIPGITSCLNCTVQAALNAEEEVDRESCDNVPEPSIITTSKIATGIMGGELMLYLKGLNSELINGQVVYDIFEPQRIGVIRKTEVCNC